MNSNDNNVPSIQNENQLSQALNGLISAQDNNQLQMTQKILKKFSRTPKCIQPYFNQIISNPDQHIRQVAAVLLRVLVKDKWMKIPDNQAKGIKNGLMKRLTEESFHLTRKAIIHCLAEIAVLEIPVNKFPEISQYVLKLIQSGNSEFQSCGVEFFDVVLRKIPEQMQKNLGSITNVFLKCLQTGKENLIASTLQSCEGLVAACIEYGQIIHVSRLIGPLVQTMQLLMKNDYDVTPVFSVLDEIAGVASGGVDEFDNQIPPLINCMINIAQSNNCSEYHRRRAIDVMGWCVRSNYPILMKSGFVDRIISTISICLCVEEPKDVEESQMTIYKCATSLFDEFCCHVPSSYIFQKVVTEGRKLVSQQHWIPKKAGLTILGVMAEGCFERAREMLKVLVPLVCSEFDNDRPEVRKVAVMALINFSEYLQPDIVNFHENIFPIIIKGLDDPIDINLQKVCLLIDQFCDEVKTEHLCKSVETIMMKLARLLSTRRGSTELKQNIISSIGTIAENLESRFERFYKQILELMEKVITLTGQDSSLLNLRGSAIECIGIVARAVGANVIGPQVNRYMNLVLQQVQQSSDNELREFSLNFITNMALALGPQFEPYLTRCMDFVMESLLSADGYLVPRVTGMGDFLEEMPMKNQKEIILEELDTTNFRLNVHQDVMEEKCAALNCLGTIAENVKIKFRPYFARSMEYLQKHIQYMSLKFQRTCANTIVRIVFAVIPTPITPQMDGNALQSYTDIFDGVIELYIERIGAEKDKETVARCCDALGDIIKKGGKFAIKNNVDDIGTICVELMLRDTECYMDDLDAWEGENAEADHDIVLFNSVLLLIDNYAKLMGAEFGQYMDRIFQTILKLLRSNSMENRISIIGTLAEITEGMKTNAAKYAQVFLPEVMKIIKENISSSGIQRNGLFLLGAVTLHCTIAASKFSNEIIGIIVNVLQNPNNYERVVVDNACGAMSRVILAVGNNLPLHQLLPLLLNNLPLEDDFEELDIVLKCLSQLIQRKEKNIMSMKNAVSQYVNKQMSMDDFGDEERKKINNFMNFLRNTN